MDVRDPPLHAHSSPQHRRNTKKINKKTWGKKWEKWRSVLFFVSSLVLQIRFNSWCGFVAFFVYIFEWSICGFKTLEIWVSGNLRKKHHETPTQRVYIGCYQRQHVRSFLFWYLSNWLRGLQIVGTFCKRHMWQRGWMYQTGTKFILMLEEWRLQVISGSNTKCWASGWIEGSWTWLWWPWFLTQRSGMFFWGLKVHHESMPVACTPLNEPLDFIEFEHVN